MAFSLKNSINRALIIGDITPRTRMSLLRILITYAVLIGLGILFLYPLLWMMVTSLRTTQEVVRAPVWDLWPETWRFENYTDAFETFPALIYLRNTFITTIIPVILGPLSSSLVAFAFARIPVRGRNTLFMLVLSTMFLPAQVTIIPTFIIYRNLGMIDTLYPLFIRAGFASAFWIFLLRQFYAALPKSLEEAAIIDGASYIQIWWRIFLPLSRPALVAMGVLTFMGGWNNFFGPATFIFSDRWKTLSLALQAFQGQYWANTTEMMAVNLFVIAPLILLFFFAQRVFIEGITFTGMKG